MNEALTASGLPKAFSGLVCNEQLSVDVGRQRLAAALRHQDGLADADGREPRDVYNGMRWKVMPA